MTAWKASGRSGRSIPIVSSSESRPSSTSDSATAPEKALATLAMRIWSLSVGSTPPATSATPAVWISREPPRWTTTITPGGPVGMATSSSMACSRASSASSPSEAEWEQAAAPNDATRPNASTARNDMARNLTHPAADRLGHQARRRRQRPPEALLEHGVGHVAPCSFDHGA